MTKLAYLCGFCNIGIFTLEFNPVGSSSFVSDQVENESILGFRTAGTLSKMAMVVYENDLDAVGTFQLRKNGSDVNQTFSVTSSTTGIFEDTSNTDAVVAADQFTIEGDGLAASSGTAKGFLKIIFEPSSGQKFIHRSVMSLSNISGDRDSHLFSSWTSGFDSVQIRAKYPMTIKNLYVNVWSNASTGTTFYNFKVDDIAVNVGLSVPTVTTGIFEDTSNTDDVVVDDLIHLQADASAGTGTVQAIASLGLESSSYTIYSARKLGSITSGETEYNTLVGQTNAVTENLTQMLSGQQNFDKLDLHVTSNTGDFIVTGTFRINGADGNNTVSIGAGSTGFFEDASNIDEVTDNAKVNVVATGASGTGTVVIATFNIRSTNKQFARPSGDQAIGNWEDEGAGTTNIYQSIDEIVPDDTDYVTSEESPSSSLYEANLSNIDDPQTSDDHVVRYRYRRDIDAETIDIIVRLKQGGTTIASKTHTGVTTTWTEGEFVLTGTEADNITDYTNLRVELSADAP